MTKPNFDWEYGLKLVISDRIDEAPFIDGNGFIEMEPVSGIVHCLREGEQAKKFRLELKEITDDE